MSHAAHFSRVSKSNPQLLCLHFDWTIALWGRTSLSTCLIASLCPYGWAAHRAIAVIEHSRPPFSSLLAAFALTCTSQLLSDLADLFPRWRPHWFVYIQVFLLHIRCNPSLLTLHSRGNICTLVQTGSRLSTLKMRNRPIWAWTDDGVELQFKAVMAT